MNYLESLEYLDELSTFGTKLGLGRIKQLVTYLDNPQTRYKTIHITGTNGKGSTSSMLSSILTTSNIKNRFVYFTSFSIIYRTYSNRWKSYKRRRFR
mgnify:CR=1 FL=1